jgi:hypothetical protein
LDTTRIDQVSEQLFIAVGSAGGKKWSCSNPPKLASKSLVEVTLTTTLLVFVQCWTFLQQKSSGVQGTLGRLIFI